MENNGQLVLAEPIAPTTEPAQDRYDTGNEGFSVLSYSNTDLHELNSSYSVLFSEVPDLGKNERPEIRVINIDFTIAAVLRKQTDSELQKLKISDSKLPKDFSAEVFIPKDYPISPPTIKFQEIVKQFEKHFQLDQNGCIDLSKTKFGVWKESNTLLDVVDFINIQLECIHQGTGVKIRDFAYPTYSPCHWGRYTLSGGPLRKVKAVFDFEAADENELSFNIGDVIDVIYERTDGWLVGMLNGLSGLVPANHVESTA